MHVIMDIKMEFKIRKGDLEVRSCNDKLLLDGEHTTAEIIHYFDGEKSHYTLAYWVIDSEGFKLKFVYDRPFKVDHHTFMLLAQEGQDVLDNAFAIYRNNL